MAFAAGIEAESSMIRDVLVHLDGSEADELRLQHAEAIAGAFQAHLTGLFTNALPDLTMAMTPESGAAAVPILQELEADARREGDAVQQRLAERFSRVAVPNEIRRVDGTIGEIADRAVSEARWADLFVASQPYGENGGARWSELFEAVLFGSGRGVYAIPQYRKASNAISRIVVAWRDTRESTRSVAEAAPFIQRAVRTAVIIVDPPTSPSANVAGADIARHLDRYGTAVEMTVIESGDRLVSEVILDQARRMSADLIVMGGYGHSRAREWILGGVTREMLERSEFPILMAH
jgi:nucleotide-binding universal stress UspA family protein